MPWRTTTALMGPTAALLACGGPPAANPATPTVSLRAPAADSAEPEPDPEPELGEIGTIQSIEGSVATVRTHEPSPAAEAARHEAECDAGAPAACHAAALDAYYRPSTPESDAAARDRFDEACRAGYAPSCNGLGLLHAQGRGVPQDPKEAARLYELSCQQGASTGCDHLAQALRQGAGVPVDETKAARAEARGACVFEVSLKHGDPSRCPTLDPAKP